MSTYPTSHDLAIVPEPTRHVVIAPPAHPSEKNKRAFTIVGAFQLIVGIIFAIMGVYVATQGRTSSRSTISGIATGILYGITGALALATGNGPTRCNVNGGMVLAIFSAISSGGSAAFGGVVLAGLGYGASSAFGMVIALLAIYTLEFILAIVHAAYCCSGSCCSSSHQTGTILQMSNVITYPQRPQVNVAPPAYGKTDLPCKPYLNEIDK